MKNNRKKPKLEEKDNNINANENISIEKEVKLTSIESDPNDTIS